jgi:hypothetical protein
MKRVGLVAALLALVAATSIVPAQSQTFGSWTSSTTSREYVSAFTQNDSGNAFGQWCYPNRGSCIWMLGLRTACVEGSQYPVLVNSDSGSASLRVYCDGVLPSPPGMYRYVFTSFDSITTPVVNSKRIGFAFPLQGDEFTVVRFDLDGVTSALRVMRAAAATRVQPGRRGTLDEKL